MFLNDWTARIKPDSEGKLVAELEFQTWPKDSAMGARCPHVMLGIECATVEEGTTWLEATIKALGQATLWAIDPYEPTIAEMEEELGARKEWAERQKGVLVASDN